MDDVWNVVKVGSVVVGWVRQRWEARAKQRALASGHQLPGFPNGTEDVIPLSVRLYLYFSGSEHGTLDVTLTVFNRSWRSLEARQVTIGFWMHGGRSIPCDGSFFEAQGRLPGQRVGTVRFTRTLNGATLRELIAAMQPAQNLLSVPTSRSSITGRLQMRTYRHRDLDIPFQKSEIILEASVPSDLLPPALGPAS